jgi:hypothetical protein
MTTFKRNGYLRKSVYGHVHWVRDHYVDRDTWDRSAFEGSSAWEKLDEVSAGRSFSSTFVNPNAVCPICEEAVFFYQNAAGSRVYFDELGPPWPKHPCTDSSSFRDQGKANRSGYQAPNLRDSQEANDIDQLLCQVRCDPLENFHSTYNLAPWDPYILEATLKHSSQRLLVLRSLDVSHGKTRRLYIKINHSLRGIKQGDLVFHYRGWLSYLDTDRFHPVDIEGVRLKGASEAISSLLEVSSEI